MNDSTVTLLLNCHGQIRSAHASREAAQAIADRYNADPWLDCESPDPDAPYTTATWAVQ